MRNRILIPLALAGLRRWVAERPNDGNSVIKPATQVDYPGRDSQLQASLAS